MLMKIAKIGCAIVVAVLGIYFAATGNYIACGILSMVVSIGPILMKVGKWGIRLFQRELPPPSRQGLGNTALLYTVCFMAAAGLLRYAVNGYVLAHPDDMRSVAEMLGLNAVAPTVGVQMVDAMLRAIRSIGILEDYTTFIAALKAVWSVVFPHAEVWGTVMVVYATAMNIAIPIAGSTLILGLFAEVFPRFQLWVRSLFWWRDKCYFSTLNAQSLTLARSILEESKREKKHIPPLLVFTDAYVDDESEQSYEWMMEAKRLGAICLRDDLTHVPKSRFFTRKYFLIEEDEYANMPSLTGLLAEHNVPYLKSALIYVFVQSDLHVRLEQNIRQRLLNSACDIPEDKMPVVIPVNAHRNLVNNLMVDVPLFEPLVGTEKEKLNVTILGNGSIGTEAFLSAYWFSQMLVKSKEDDLPKECAVTIHVVSQDTESAFWAKIDTVNPEIRCTTCSGTDCPRRKGDGAVPSVCARPHILHWRPDRPANAPYCTVQYHQIEDVKMGALDHQDWLDTDYVIVALGSDASNITVAEKLRAHIGRRHFEQADTLSHTVIAYVVYDSELCDDLNGSAAENGVYMHAFGSLKEVYSCDNVFMSKSRLLATGMGKAYQQQAHVAEQKERKANADALYRTLADQARAMHVKYKLFSLGWVTDSLFTQSKAEHKDTLEKLSERYRSVVAVAMPDAVTRESSAVLNDVPLTLLPDDGRYWLDLQKKRHRLAWLEHRRWSAYTRTMGFRFTDAMRENMETQGNHKNMPLKLHTCLVEARKPMGADTYIGWALPESAAQKPTADQMPTAESLWKEHGLMDYLDYHHHLRLDAIYAVLAPKKSEAEMKKIKGFASCKRFDYYFGEFEEFLSVDAFFEKTGNCFAHMTREWMLKKSKSAKEGAFSYNGQEYVCVSVLEKWIGEQYVAVQNPTECSFNRKHYKKITFMHRCAMLWKRIAS